MLVYGVVGHSKEYFLVYFLLSNVSLCYLDVYVGGDVKDFDEGISSLICRKSLSLVCATCCVYK